MLPYLNPGRGKTLRTQWEFRGLNQTLAASPSEFADMKNVSARLFPAVTARKPRGTTETVLQNPNGLSHKNGLFYVDGTQCFYDGEEVQGLTVTNSKKQIVGMGAYLVIFPDKVMYNTFDGTVKHLESTYTQSGTITFEPTFEGSVLTKVTATGIGNSFETLDAVEITGCEDEQFNTTKVIREKDTDYLIIDGVLSETLTQASGLTFRRKVPDMDFICEKDNRLWGCSSENHEIYASKLGDPSNWYSFEQISTDSYAVTVGSDGDFTGCVAHLGHVLFFKENTIHMMYGDRPSNFSLVTSEMPGVREGCSESIEIVNETLYYVGRSGVYAFDGSVPQKISENILDEITDAVATQEDGNLYLSAKMGGTQTILVYDPRLQIWDKENGEQFVLAAYGDGKGWYVDYAGKLKTLTGDDEETVEWMVESADIREDSVYQKFVSKLMFSLRLSVGSVATFYIKVDDYPSWVRKGSITATRDAVYTLPIVTQRCGRFRWKMEVRGDGRLLTMARSVEGGTELNGTIHHGHRGT